MFTIGELSKRTGVHIETVRYYERSAVLPKAVRTANGRRAYGTADVQRLIFIRHARELGFELSTVRMLLDLQDDPDATCAKATEIATAQLVAIEGKISRLEVLRGELTRMIEGCSNVRVAECRIIESLTAAFPTIEASRSGLADLPRQRYTSRSSTSAKVVGSRKT